MKDRRAIVSFLDDLLPGGKKSGCVNIMQYLELPILIMEFFCRQNQGGVLNVTRCSRLVLGWLTLIVIGLIGICHANPLEYERPRVALALGGGSAKGFAHIGVIRWLEEHRIPVDLVSGTSMGGLVGGCYAMGMETTEIYALANEMEWSKVFASVPPYDALNYRRKEDRRDYVVEAQFGRKGKNVGLPSGFTSYAVDFLLSRLTLTHSTVENFADLPLPYSCTATDLISSELVVQERGSLVESMRSTMAIPGIFAPVRRNGQILVDGGILNNVPADVARQMGGDVVIAVNLSAKAEHYEINGINDVLLRTINTVLVDNSRRAMSAADVVVTPRLQGLGSMDWDKLDELVKRGYEAAEAQRDLLLPYAVDEETWRAWKLERQWKRRTEIPVPMGIEVVGATEAHEKMVLKRLWAYIGVPMDTDALEKDLIELIGTGRFESFRYECFLHQDEPILRVTVVEKPYQQPYVETAVHLEADSVRAEHIELNARTRLTWLDQWGEGSEARLDLGIGTENHFLAEIYKPFGRSLWFVAPSLFLDQNNSSLYREDRRITDYKTTHTGFLLDFGLGLSDFTEARLGYGFGFQDVNVKVGEELTEDYDGSLQWVRLKWVYNHADNPIWPRRGTHWQTEAKWFLEAPGATERFGTLESTLRLNFPAGEKDGYFLRLSAGSGFGGELPLAQDFKLGGPFRLGTYCYDEFHGNHYLLANLGYMKYLLKWPMTDRDVFLGVWAEFGDVFDRWSKVDLDYALSIGLISPTIIGPIYIGASYGEGDNHLFYLGVGKVF